jgi:serine/threonine-protein phosphatase 2A regulatory subunit A
LIFVQTYALPDMSFCLPPAAKLEDLDQVLLAIAEKLGLFLPLVGGPEHAPALIPLFEALCEIEEITVRDMTVASINKILKQLGPAHKAAVAAYFELFKRLSNEEAGELFYARVSCCHFVAELYRLLNDADRAAVRETYTRLCKDELSIVRRAAALQVMKLAPLLTPDLQAGEFLALLQTLVSDESQVIQVVAIEQLAEYAVMLKEHNHVAQLTSEVLPLVKSFADSTSWKVRQALSRKYGLFAKAFLAAEVSSEVFTCVINLIQDPEPEVRSLAILEVLPFLEVVGTAQFIGELAPAAGHLVQDPMPSVRKLLADLCVDVAAKVGPEAVAMHLSDLIMKLMEDEDAMVRLRIIVKLPIIAEEAPSLCTRLTECLKALFANTNWRVRKQLLTAMPAIVKHMGQDFFIDHFLAPTLSLLKDQVDEVRTACCAIVPQIAAVSDPNWVHEAIFPAVKSMASGEYLVRLSMISALEGFLRLDTLSEKFHGEVLTMLVATAADKVPNIRIRAAQAMNAALVAPHAEPFKDKLQAALNELLKDKDKDVKYFAGKAVHE